MSPRTWHALPKGICEVVAKQDIMRIDAVLHNSQTGKVFRKGGSRKDFVKAMSVKCDRVPRECIPYQNKEKLKGCRTSMMTAKSQSNPQGLELDTAILIAYYESTFNTNDSPSFSWKKAGSDLLKAKSKGKGMSEYLCGCVMGRKQEGVTTAGGMLKRW
ncbi:hypothetical protein V8E54_013517 [Elaphomyces granulatus]